MVIPIQLHNHNVFCNHCNRKHVTSHGADRHASNFLHICCSSSEGSDKDTVESIDLASTSPPDMLSKIKSSLPRRDAISFAPPNLSCSTVILPHHDPSHIYEDRTYCYK
ncbi:hypothetical protein L6164_009406 [Bauhinia variegata]|uniref:Uncharacterized protein n=1 Tax=Bauhinia variegata TaxID=167791 RepID=A0ACB9PIL9_BAUVA|nr:hypothetical protein L6164_009406 [Bauhinia variegata]